MSIPPRWQQWCNSGIHGGRCKKVALRMCLKNDNGQGYFSDFPLDPELPHTHSMYPSIDHLKGREFPGDVVVETRLVNDMKSHMSEDEFWRLIEHLFFVGVSKGRIASTSGRRLKNGWHPDRNYERKGT